MAIFETRYEQALALDDTQAIYCVIETTQEVNGHTEYLLRIQRGPNKENCWKILRRYNDFAELHKCLSISGIQLPMPGKRFIGNMRPDFIAERRQALQIYINAVLMNPILASSLPAKRFIDPDSYSKSFHDHAVQNASLCLRNDNMWVLGTTLGPIGWRLRKHYFKVFPKPPEKTGSKLVKSGSQSYQSSGGSLDSATIDSSELVLEWIEYGPDKHVDDKELGGILKSFLDLKHPYIEPIIYTAYNENGCLVIRKFHKHGTLKDILCMSTPKNPYQTKYGNPKGRTALTVKQVAAYGHQILETLIYLHAKGYPYGHLHAGNIAIVNDCVKLLDIENYILGVPAFYRPFFVQHSKIHSIETIDVYCFGHVIFEMAMGYPLQESFVRQINECPESLQNLLEKILSKEAFKSGLPTLDQLIDHEFFRQHAASVDGAVGGEKPHFKLSQNVKELLKQVSQKCENRLRDEQKSVKNQKRIARVQELMSSEEEKRQTKQKAKLEHKQLKLKQQSSLQSSNGRPPQSSAVNSGVSMNAPPLNHSNSVLSANLSNNVTPTSTISAPQLISAEQQQTETTAAIADVEITAPLSDKSSNDQNEPARSALFESICKFNRGSLRKVSSND